MGGLVIGQEVARQLGVRFIFAEKEEGKLVLRRGFKIAPGEKILVVEDVVTKGGRVQETIDIVRAHGGKVVGVAMVVDRSNGAVNFGVPFVSLIALQVETFEPDKLAAGPGKNSRRQTGQQIIVVARGAKSRRQPDVSLRDFVFFARPPTAPQNCATATSDCATCVAFGTVLQLRTISRKSILSFVYNAFMIFFGTLRHRYCIRIGAVNRNQFYT